MKKLKVRVVKIEFVVCGAKKMDRRTLKALDALAKAAYKQYASKEPK